MKSQQDMCAVSVHQGKPTRRNKKGLCRVAEAYGMPAVKLPHATAPSVVDLGTEAAETYLLGAFGSEGLAEAVARLRGATPARHWPDVEAGFMARLEQFLRSKQVAP